MGPKYAKGQRVEVVSAINGDGKPKYSDIETHIGEFGVITEYYHIGYKAANLPHNCYVYRIRLDIDDSMVSIPEDALRGLID